MSQLIDVDNPENFEDHNDQEPDQKDYVVVTPKVIDTFVGSPYDNDKVSIPDDTPSEMNEWLRQGGW